MDLHMDFGSRSRKDKWIFVSKFCIMY